MFNKHPKGLIPAALSNMGERFGYYIMNAVLVLFLCSKFGISEEKSTLIYSFFYAGIYLLSLVGGLIADRKQNYKGTIMAGLVVMAIGYIALSSPITANAGNSEWLTTAPFATVQATDDTAPIAKLEISADQGKSWTTIAANANAAIATLSQQGDVEVWARATDQAGNVSDVAKAGGKVDSAAPTVTAAADKE